MLNDLNTVATGILNSTLLTPEKTTKWLKPTKHTAHLNHSVGGAGVVMGVYTKSSGSGSKRGAMVLILHYGAGFDLIVEFVPPLWSRWKQLALDAVVRELLPALKARTAAGAKASFSGTYRSTDSGLNMTLNAGINGDVSSLNIMEQISNGAEILANQGAAFSTTGGLRFLPFIAERSSNK
ncbi:hypothetical protein JX265_012732 [Neoarthrinium moseri]|uniref:Uncharacterized protein n=1 Tax=Neoarthrinium moseri TaxID=1658444 RepID=A0A9Q0AGI1_9PEZI|nr:hypothetical protein JX265_012732 [Neoarthrinium moseri]